MLSGVGNDTHQATSQSGPTAFGGGRAIFSLVPGKGHRLIFYESGKSVSHTTHTTPVCAFVVWRANRRARDSAIASSEHVQVHAINLRHGYHDHRTQLLTTWAKVGYLALLLLWTMRPGYVGLLYFIGKT